MMKKNHDTDNNDQDDIDSADADADAVKMVYGDVDDDSKEEKDTKMLTKFVPGMYEEQPIIDQEGRSWRSPKELIGKRLRRDGLFVNANKPWTATMSQHTMMLRNSKTTQFIVDEERWLQRYDALCQFYQRYGHTNVPFFDTNNNSKSTTTQQTDAKDDYSDEDDNDHILESFDDDHMLDSYDDELDDEEYDWEEDSNDDEGDTLVEEEMLEPYTARMELGFWVAQQRYYYNHPTYNETRLTVQRIAFLNKLNFTWNIANAKWEAQYQLLRNYYHKHGHTAVPQSTPLGRWVYKQRYHRLQIKRNQTIDMTTVPPSAFPSHNNNNHDTASTTNTNHIHDNNSMASLEDAVLDVSGGGKIYKGKLISPLTPHRRKLLNDINFIWDHRQAQWERQYQNLETFVQQYNHTRPSPTEYPSLAKWVRKHRAEYTNINTNNATTTTTNSTLLTPERIDKLNQLQFQWIVRPHTWEDHYQHLLHYKQIYGHANPPQTYHDEDYHPKLGAWVTSQRAAMRKFKTQYPTSPKNNDTKEYVKYQRSQERYEKLCQLGVVFDTKFRNFETKYQQIIQTSPSTWNKSTQKWISSIKIEYQKHIENQPCKLDSQQLELLQDTNFSSIPII